MKLIRYSIILITIFCWISSQGQRSRPAAVLQERAEQAASDYFERKAEADSVARAKGWAIREELPDGKVIELVALAENGMPLYFSTENINAAYTVGVDDLWPGGSSGLSLTGSGFTISEWDAGAVRSSHHEFMSGGQSRITQIDGATSTHPHATHVAGTMVAQGVNGVAKGMSPQAHLHAYDWNNDNSEMISANATYGTNLSNHSYGYVTGWYLSTTPRKWYGDTVISGNEDHNFGFYGPAAHDWDDLAYSMPDFLIVKSAGNDRTDNHYGMHLVYNSTTSSWDTSYTPREKDGGADGYDCISHRGVAKNILTVGAVNDIPGGYAQPSDVVMTTFSGWGPTDDGRIKPDIVANGTSLNSTSDYHDSAYVTYSGTSMSAPNTTGALALLQDYFFDTLGRYMWADELKALVINTAHEAGTASGPDYRFGWGLLNAAGAAELITLEVDEGGHVFFDSLVNGGMDQYVYYADGIQDINVTLAWTDPAHAALPPALNPTTPTLVNDLDLKLLRLPDSLSYMPWVLDPANPATAATTGDNIRDNVEKVTIAAPNAGYYRIVVDHKDTLGSPQYYGMAISGMRPTIPGLWTGTYGSDWNNPANWDNWETPDSTTHIELPPGRTTYPVLNGTFGIGTNSADYNCGSLEVGPGAEFTIGGGQ